MAAAVTGPTTRWRAQAACRGKDPALFHPLRNGVRQAKAVCAACPVCDDCLAYALGHEERVGVWGGLTAPERDALHRRLAQAGGRSCP